MDADFIEALRITTSERFRLRWLNGTARGVITTPCHHFSLQFGQFPTIGEMTRIGRATAILAPDALDEVVAERTTYSVETAHLFERRVVHGMIARNAAAKSVENDACHSTSTRKNCTLGQYMRVVFVFYFERSKALKRFGRNDFAVAV